MTRAADTFWAPKAGCSETEYEDASAASSRCIAIADGATESSFARAWAEGLVHGFVSEQLPPGERAPWMQHPDGGSVSPDQSAVNRRLDEQAADLLHRRLAPLQKAWHDSIGWDRLPWFAEEKARSGAFSSLLVCYFPRGGAPDDLTGCAGSLPWKAFAVGDSCLFQLRGEVLVKAFPIDRAIDFNSRPVLIASNPANNARVFDAVKVHEGVCLPGDLFLFATDALACWSLSQQELGGNPWLELRRLGKQQDFDEFVARLRNERLVRNDDMTLVRYTVPRRIGRLPHEAATDTTRRLPPYADHGSESDAVGATEREEPLLAVELPVSRTRCRRESNAARSTDDTAPPNANRPERSVPAETREGDPDR